MTAGTRCLNCGAELTGRYCVACGQKHDPEIHSLGHFAGEAFENVTHADSRLWRTLGTLITKPGRLTREFFDGRRVRYLPPVRFYLIVSLMFFLLVGWSGSMDDGIVTVDVGDTPAKAAASAKRPDRYCDEMKYSGPWQKEIQARLPDQCRKVLADRGRGLASVFIQNMPRALFVLLPLLAAMMTLLYWRPRRYYVEHLLFFLHNHVYLFLGYSVLILLDMLFPDSGWVGLLGFLFHLYLLVYFYRAMRTVYAQGRALTLVKYVTIGLVYVFVGTTTIALTLFFSAITL